MADQSKAEISAENTDTQQASMPDAEQKTADPEVPQAASPQGEGQQETKGKEAKLPEGVKERTTKEFQKLRKQLAEERSKRVKAEKVFTDLGQIPQPVDQAQPQQQPTVPSYFNPETGEIDVSRLEQQNIQLRNQVAQLGQQVQGITDAEQYKQEQEAYAAYPELDPNRDEFNQTFHNAVSGYLTNTLLKGDRVTFKTAADNIAGLSKKEVKKAEKAGADKALEQLTPKEQASLEAAGRSDKRKASPEELEELRRRTRQSSNSKDSLDAIVTRLRRSTPSN